MAASNSRLLTTSEHSAGDKSSLDGTAGQHTAEACIEEDGYNSERDYCIPEDEESTKGVYVSLVQNPERFTGYMGDHAHAIWEEIYRENCFELQPTTVEEEEWMSRTHFGQPGRSDLEAVMLGKYKRGNAKRTSEYNQLALENTCLEKRVFWKLISGMHTSISTHLCWDHLNQTTGEWVPVS